MASFRSAVSAAAALLLAAAPAAAHMILNTPVPYGHPDNSPLKVADWPCKIQGGFAVTQMNTVQAGGSLPFSFMGTTVHTGGSCQFSVTTDVPPTANSQWKVIHSAVGGCVSNYTDNFSPANAYALGLARVYDITFPQQMPSGQYSVAWTWFNKEAEAPEFYMNCAPVTVAGGTGDMSYLQGLPDMFVANLGSPASTCSSAGSGDLVFPQPGDSVETETVTPLVPVSTVTGAGCNTMTLLGRGAGTLGSPAAGSATPSSPAGYGATSKASYGAPTTQASYGAPTTHPSYGASTSSQSAYGAATSVSVAAAAAASPASPSASPSGVPAVPCTNEGGVVCIGSNQFGLCNFGWAVAQNLADGQQCPGTVNATAPAIKERAVRRLSPHARRHGMGLHS